MSSSQRVENPIGTEFENPNPDMLTEWAENNLTASMNLVKILVKYAQIDCDELLKEIDKLNEQIERLEQTEYISKTRKEIQDRIKKQEDKIKLRKVHKFARDKEDYEQGNIFTFSRRYENVNKMRLNDMTRATGNPMIEVDERSINS